MKISPQFFGVTKCKTILMTAIILFLACEKEDDPGNAESWGNDPSVAGEWNIIEYTVEGESNIQDQYTSNDGLPLKNWRFLSTGSLEIEIATLIQPEGTGEIVSGNWSTKGEELKIEVSNHLDESVFYYTISADSSADVMTWSLILTNLSKVIRFEKN